MPPVAKSTEKSPSEIMDEHIQRSQTLKDAKSKVMAEYNEVRGTLRMLANAGFGTDEQRKWVAENMPVIERKRRNGQTDSESTDDE